MEQGHWPQFLKGIELFNREEFYQCHDTIEEIWLEEAGEGRLFLQGLIQAAVAFHHYQSGKWGAARSMLKLSIEKLESCSPAQLQIVGEAFVAKLRHWKTALDQGIAKGSREAISLPYPKIKV